MKNYTKLGLAALAGAAAYGARGRRAEREWLTTAQETALIDAEIAKFPAEFSLPHEEGKFRFEKWPGSFVTSKNEVSLNLQEWNQSQERWEGMGRYTPAEIRRMHPQGLSARGRRAESDNGRADAGVSDRWDHIYEVIVGNIGTVYSGDDGREARRTYEEYKRQSQSNYGRAGGEDVTFMEHGEPLLEHFGQGQPNRGRRALPQVRAPQIVSVQPHRYGFSHKYHVEYSDGTKRWAYRYDPRFKQYIMPVPGEAARGRRADRVRVYKNIDTLRKAASHGDVNLDNLMTGRFRHKDEGWVSFRLKSYAGIPQAIAQVLGGRADTQRHVSNALRTILIDEPEKTRKWRWVARGPISSRTAERIVYSKYGKWPAQWEYVAGQNYPAETARIREALTRR